MNTAELISLVESGNMDQLKSTLEQIKLCYFLVKSLDVTNDCANFNEIDARQYNPKTHDVFDKAIRKNKIINKEVEVNGQLATQIEAVIPVARLGIPEQKKIVLMAATFLGVPQLVATPADDLQKQLLEVINRVSEDNKLDYQFRDVLKKTMSERECAELWYTQEAETGYWAGTPMDGAKFKLRMRLLSPSLGDTLLPVFDSFGDMIAFGRNYQTLEINEQGLQIKVKHFDVYTKDRFYFLIKKDAETDWVHTTDLDADGKPTEVTEKGISNPIGKIPVIYYRQEATEWYDVQEMIDRLEKKMSNHADTNDYYDSPIVKAKGEVKGFSEKGESGKVLQMDENADAEYLTYDNLPESMKMEMDNLTSFINKYTHTPDISFDNVKALGTFSGIALKMFFMDAHLKASDKEELFGQAVQRRINYLKAAIAVIKQSLKPATHMVIKPKFEYFLPKDVDGEVQTLVNAYQAGIISLETAVKLNPLVTDAVNEMELIKADEERKVKSNTPNPLPGLGGIK